MKKITGHFILIILALLTNFSLVAQEKDIVIGDSIKFLVHKTSVGKIAFMKENIPIENFKEADFLKSFQIVDKSDLNIRVFLGNSLTNYLHQLSPGLSKEELTKNGNYQFNFFVDGQKIYTENLNAGAGSAENKNQKTVFRIPLISTANEDSWGIFLWNRFLMNGGQDAFSTGSHRLKLEIRPYLKMDQILTGNIIAEGQIAIIIPEIKINKKFITVQKIQALKDWEISKEQFDTALIESLNEKIAAKVFKDITSLVVIKNGKLLIEEYFGEAKRNTLHDTRSVGKSFASTITGIAVQEAYIKSETQTLKEFYNLKSFQNYDVAKENISIKDLLTMSTVLDASDRNEESPGNEEKMYPSKNWVDFTLNLPVDTSKITGKRWDYFTAGVVILGDIIHKSVPDGLEKYAEKKLFQPLGITQYKWQFTPQNVANTAGSLQMRSLDYAKYGQLYKNNGNWKGTQIITQDWVTKSLSHQQVISENEYYGYLFWNKTYSVAGKDYEVYYSSGNGGNKIIIFKDYPYVIVLTATAYNKAYSHSQVDKILEHYVIPAIVK